MKFVLEASILFVILSDVMCSLRDDWQQFKSDYNKTYPNGKEEAKRFRIFVVNVKEIRNHNRKFRKNLSTYEKGVNIFADLTKEEFSEKYGLHEFTSTVIYKTAKKKTSYPLSEFEGDDYFDWREKGAVTPAKDQGYCGSCWIFSAVGALEGYHFRKTGKLVSLSEQNIVDCLYDSTCSGGVPEFAFKFAKVNGINAEADYPYQGKKMNCSTLESKIVNVTYDKLEYLRSSEDKMKEALVQFGPLSVCMYATSKWRFYKSGVYYERECSEITNHCLLVVGYGTENGYDYWIVKNSWGHHWGQDGFIKFIRDEHPNYCGISSMVAYIR